jgi:hypothetical protein
MNYYREYTLPLAPPTTQPCIPNWGGRDFDQCFLIREYDHGAGKVKVLYSATRGEINTWYGLTRATRTPGKAASRRGGCHRAPRLRRHQG